MDLEVHDPGDVEGEATSEDIVETDDETESEWSVHTSDDEFIVED